METLYEKLLTYHTLDIYPMHMPGHKRNASLMGIAEGEQALSLASVSQIDITEIDGFDNLGAPEGVIKDAMERAARIYQADETYFLVNGSTVGLLSGIMGATTKGDQVLVARNCHKAVYNALYLNELSPVYIYPKRNQELGFYEEVEPEQIEKQLKAHPEISLVVITSPTYEGVVSDIKTIAEIVHRYDALLLIDEAHGAHFGFHPHFPVSALSLGADIVIQSLHKTMPAFTQTALLHIKGNKAPRERIRNYLAMLQSSSPSYVLMAGLDHCIKLMEDKGKQLFVSYVEKLNDIGNRLTSLQHLSLYQGPNREGAIKDASKIVIGVRGVNYTAKELYHELLHKYKIQLEMVSKDYGIAMTSIGDTLEGFQRLCEALLEIDKRLQQDNNQLIELPRLYEVQPERAVLNIYDSLNSKMESIPLSEAVGRVSGAYVYQYPPGIPVLVPGEVITKEIVDVLALYDRQEFKLVGLEDNLAEEKNIQVLTG